MTGEVPDLRRALALFVVALAAVITPLKISHAGPAEQPPSWRAAVAAWRRGDELEAVRLGHEAGRQALRAGLASRELLEVTVALVVVARQGAPWPLAELAALAKSADRRRARAAVGVARELVAHLGATGPDGAAADGLDGVELVMARDRWLSVAREPARWSDVRSDSLEVAAALGQLAWQAGEATSRDDTGRALLAFFDDEDAALRRAAIELSPAPLTSEISAALAARVTSEREPAVAAAAAAALCAELAEPEAVPGPILALLGAAGLAEVQRWTRAHARPGAAEVALARCLIAAGDPSSAQALRHLREVAQGPVRRALAAVERGER